MNARRICCKNPGLALLCLKGYGRPTTTRSTWSRIIFSRARPASLLSDTSMPANVYHPKGFQEQRSRVALVVGEEFIVLQRGARLSLDVQGPLERELIVRPRAPEGPGSGRGLKYSLAPA
jgi:hypothetical protein